jgi:hypothetical protein
MGKVWWSDQAAAELEAVKPRTARNLLKRKAEEILHVISPRTGDPADEGVEGEIMWHRGDSHGRFTKLQDYFLLYKRRDPASGSEDPEGDPDFEVLAVCSIYQVACIWRQMGYGGGQSH